MANFVAEVSDCTLLKLMVAVAHLCLTVVANGAGSWKLVLKCVPVVESGGAWRLCQSV